jgi:hypothetical protein
LLRPQARCVERARRHAAGNRREDFFEGQVRAVRVAGQVDAAGGGADLVLQGVDRAGQQIAESFAAALLHEFGRVELVGEREDAQVHLGGDEQLEDRGRLVLAGFVAVEDEINRVGEPLKQPYVVVGDGRAAAGDDVAHAMLMAQHDIGVAFDDCELP